MIVLDATVLVHAVGAEHPLREPCRELVSVLEEGILTATTTPEVIQEFAHMRARRRDRADAVRLARAWTALLSPLAIVDSTALERGLELFRSQRALGAFDAVLAGVALSLGADALVSADAAFASVPGLTHFDPASPDFGELLA